MGRERKGGVTESITEIIRQRIEEAPDGTVFTNADFADISSSETKRRILNRRVKAGTLRRVLACTRSQLLGDH
mgnify:CR=1 FL=1